MAEIVEKIRYDVDADKANRDIAALEKRMTGAFEMSAVKLAVLNKALGLAGDLVGKFGSALKQGVTDALESERTTIQLQTALKVMGENVERNTVLFDAQANRLEKLTGISEESLRVIQRQALQYGVQADKVNDLTEATVLLANMTGQDLHSAFMSLIRAQDGTLDRTLKLVPGVKELTEAQLQNGDAIDLLLEKQGEFIDVKTKGMSGALLVLETSFDNFTKSIGFAVVGAEALQTEIRGMADDLADLALVFEDEGLIGGLTALAGGVLFKGATRQTAAEIRKQREAEAGSASIQAEFDKKNAEQAAAWRASAEGASWGHSAADPGLEAIPGNAKKDAAAGARAVAAAEAAAKANSRRSDRAFTRRQAEIESSNEGMAGQQKREWEAVQSYTQLEIDLVKTAQEGMTEIVESNAARRAAIMEDQARYQESQMADLTGVVQSGFATLASSGLEALEALATGADISGKKILGSALRSIGHQLFADGVSNVLKGTAQTLIGPALVTAGLAEMAAGAAMSMGGAAIVGGGGGGGKGGGAPSYGGYGGGGGKGGGGANDFLGGYSSGPDNGGRGGSSKPSITVVVEGWMSPEEAGRRTKQAIEEANRSGL